MSFIAVGAGAGYLLAGAGASAGVAALATGAGALVGSALGGSGGNNANAPQANPQQIGQDSLATQLQLAPQVLAANQLYGPQYTQLSLQQQQQALLGNFDAGAFDAAHPGFLDSFQQQQAAGQLQGWTPAQFAAAYTGKPANDPSLTQYYSGGTLGLYGQAQPALSNLNATANTAQRTADINDVLKLGPAAQQAYLAANPDLAKAMSGLDAQISAARNVTPTKLSSTYNPNGVPAPAAATAAAPGSLGATSAADPGPLGATLAADPGKLGAAYANAPAAYRTSTAGPTSLTPTLLRDAGNYAAKTPIQQALEQQALQQLAQNGQLSAEDMRTAQQTARGAAQARGIYDSNTALSAEVLNTTAMQRQRQQEAQSFASNVDAAGLNALNSGRSFATGVEGQQQNVNMFNAGQRNSTASQIYGTNANVNLANAGAENAARATSYTTLANTNLANAAAANNAASTAYTTRANTNLANATAINNAATNSYNAANAVNMFNAGANNSLSSQIYGQQNQNAQFGGQLDAAQQLNQSQLNRTATNDQIGQQLQLASLYQSQATDPFNVVLGRSGVPAQAAGALSQGGAAAGAGPQLFDPFNSNITSIYAGNQANQTAAQIAAGNNKSALTGSLLQVGGSLGAAYLMCWVARAAFGPTNPRWLAAQRWMVFHAPRTLFLLYAKRGERLAQRVVLDDRRDYFRGLFRRLIRGDARAIADLTTELNAC